MRRTAFTVAIIIICGLSTLARTVVGENGLTATQAEVAQDADKNVSQDNGIVTGLELFFESMKFDHVKLYGSYGVSFSVLPWSVCHKTYLGFNFSMGGNWGLHEDANRLIFKVGPAIGCKITDSASFICPLDLNIYWDLVWNPGKNEHEDNVDTGLSLNPALYIGGRHLGIFFGPLVTVPFVSDSDAYFGFRVGLNYKF